MGTDCAELELGEYVCPDIIGYTATATITSIATTTTPGNGVATPTNFEQVLSGEVRGLVTIIQPDIIKKGIKTVILVIHCRFIDCINMI